MQNNIILNLHKPALTRRKRKRSLFYGILLFASITIVFFTSCKTGTEQADADFFKIELNDEIIYFPGSVISGPAAVDINSLSIRESLSITVKMAALKQVPTNSLDPIESHTRMILISPSENAIVPITQLTRGSKIGFIQDSNKFIDNLIANESNNSNMRFQQLQGILVQGVTTFFHFYESKAINSEKPEGFELRIYPGIQLKEERDAGVSLEIALAVNGKLKQGVIINHDNGETEDKQKTEPVDSEQENRITETIFLKNLLLKVNTPLGIIIPSPFSDSQAKAFAVTIEVEPPPGEGTSQTSIYAESFNKFLEYLRENYIRSKASHISQSDTVFFGIDESVQALRFPTNRRGALLYLSQQTKSSLVEDIALSGTQSVLEILSDAVIQEYSSGLYKDTHALGWMLEGSVYKVLVEMLPSDKTVPELESVLVRHTGEVGRHIASLEELVAASSGREDLQNRLIKENLIYLEDMSPASRTRAFEWLAAIKKAPDGYNPLASLKERRDVLARFESDSN